MANTYADIIRIQTTEALLPTTLIAGQLGFTTDTGKLGHLMQDGVTMQWFNDNTNSWIYWDSAGNGGCTTSNPQGKFHIYTGDAGTISPSVSADELVLESAGNTGLSIFSPNANYSTINLGSPSNNAGGNISWKYDDSTLVVATGKTGGEIKLYTDAGTLAATIDDSQNVGIGVTPTAKLTIQQIGDAAGDGIRLIEGGSADYWDIFLGESQGSNIDDFNISRNAGTPFLTILPSSGNLGIGITQPTALLHALKSDGGNDVEAYIQNSAGAGADDGAVLRLIPSSSTTVGAKLITDRGGRGASEFSLYFSTGTNENIRMTIDGTSGKVGIGTMPNTYAQLHIYEGASGASIPTVSTLIVENNGSNYLTMAAPEAAEQGVVFSTPAAGGDGSMVYEGANNLLRFSAGGTITMKLVDGNVGIGVTPEAWYSGFTALQVGGLGAIHGLTAQSAGNGTYYSNNLYSDDGFLKRIVNDEVCYYKQTNGIHEWFSDAAAAPDIAFTPTARMRILANGNTIIGGGTPDGTLHVYTETAGVVTAPSTADDLIVENNDDGGVSILVPNDKDGVLNFGRPEDNEGAQVLWQDGAEFDILRIQTNTEYSTMEFYTGETVQALSIDSSQNAWFSGNLWLDTNKQIQLGESSTCLIYADSDGSSDLVIESGYDVKVDCGTNKTIELQETVWEDLRIVPGSFTRPGVSDPTLEDWQPGASGATYKIYKFKKNDYVIASCQMPHAYKEGSDMKIHVHWTPGDRGNEESGAKVGWKVDYSIADIGDAFPSSTTADLSDTCTGTDDEHELSSSVTITGTGFAISNMIMLKIYRSDTGTDDTWAGTTGAQSPGLLEVDIHYQIDTIGSRQELVK